MPVTIIPGDPGDLLCDTCTNRYADRGGRERTDESARVAGWHIYRGWSYQPTQPPSTFITRILCPQCIGTNRTRIPAPPVLPGQEDILATLGIEVEPPKQQKKGKKGREMS
jgi:hypothetical protein